MGNTSFTIIQMTVGQLVEDIRSGRTGLPDLQRPFVWKDNKIRDLFDSMLKGYPIGYVMLWESPDNYDNRKHAIGDNRKNYAEPKSLVIDGQQRLTALLAAIYGVKVKNKDYGEREVKIAYNPLTREFAVWTKAYERSPEWFDRVSAIFIADEEKSLRPLRKSFIENLNENREKKGSPRLTEQEEEEIESNINALLGLLNYTLPTLEIKRDTDEEAVADIFVRVNSGGQSLTENNFIQTLIAVYENETSDRINEFAHASRIPAQGTSYNNILALEPSHLIRMAVGVGFKRARLRYAYMLLRGKDLETGIVSEGTRQKNLTIFKEALGKVMDLNNWHAFLNIVAEAGYVSNKLIVSENAVVFSYVLYLIAKYDNKYKLNATQLSTLIRKWFFVSAITSFYTGSTETEVEKQFADLRNVNSAQAFIAYIDSVMATRFTNDYFSVTLPEELDSSSSISPTWNGYVAAQIVLHADLLFGDTPIRDYFMPGTSGSKNSIDKHHIFPKNYLTSIGINTDRERNQIANFAYIGYATNIKISDSAPREYIPRYRQNLGQQAFDDACKMHALPPDFENMNYSEFLQKRRALMAETVRRAYERLRQEPSSIYA